MLRRDLLKIAAVSIVPIPGFVPGPPTPGRIRLTHAGEAVAGGPAEYQRDTVIFLSLSHVAETVTVDGCEAYFPGETEPFLTRSFEPLVIEPSDTVDLRWEMHF